MKTNEIRLLPRPWDYGAPRFVGLMVFIGEIALVPDADTPARPHAWPLDSSS
jgi:hypothetical protein